MSERREFLKRLPLLVAPSVLGRGAHAAPSDRIHVGLIGVGRMGSGHLRGFLSHQDVRVAAICDVQQASQERAQAAVNRQYGDTNCAVYGDYREMMARADLDAVLIATGERWHPLIAVEAANRGKHIYCEKPLALSVAECKAVRAAVNRNSRVFQFGTQQRSSFYFRHAIELVRNGRIGELKTIMISSAGGTPSRLPVVQKDPPPGFDYDLWLGPSQWAPYSDMRVSIAAWLYISDYGLGGMDGAWGIHDVDIAQWVNDADATGPLEVEATAKFYTDIRDVPYEYTAEFKYANGVRMLLMDANTARKRAVEFQSLPSRFSSVFFGTEGWIYVSREGIVTHPARLAAERIGPNAIQVIRSNDHRRNFLEAIRKGRRTISPVEAAVRGQSAVQQAYTAMKLQRKLRWDPAREEYVNDPEANRWLSRPMRSPWQL